MKIINRLGSLLICSAISLVFSMNAFAHEDDDVSKLPPSKTKAQLAQARKLMDIGKDKLAKKGRYSCCIRPVSGSKASGCDLCARENGSCSCASNLAQGKGVCGDCLTGWKMAHGMMKGVNADSVRLLSASQQSMGISSEPIPPELEQARQILNAAKRTQVSEHRYACCVKKGGCDECAYETSCPCAKQAALGAKSKGVCGQCLDGWNQGQGRLAGIQPEDIKLQTMHDMGMGHGAMMMAMAGVSDTQIGSGTGWQPSSTPMHAIHFKSGKWSMMAHYNAFLSYDNQGGPRGADQINSTNWVMLMASRSAAHDQLQLRAMLSLEPLTTSLRGYPLLLQSGESYGGKPLIDRQHPHDLFMELSAKYTHPLTKDSAVYLYAAPAGEPALGPTAYPHRETAMNFPAAPISHHWQDSTHVDFGVLTIGAWKGRAQLETSWFTGREPDQNRYDLSPMHLDSHSVRFTYNPCTHWSLQASYGYLHSPEALHPEEDLHRTTVSGQYYGALKHGGGLGGTIVWGRNNSAGINTDSILLETSLQLPHRHNLFARYEFVNKLGDDLGLTPGLGKFGVGEGTLGYMYDLPASRGVQPGVGGAVTLYNYGSALKPIYGNSPVSYWLFFRIRPQ